MDENERQTDANPSGCYWMWRVLLEARGGIEPPNKGFADLCLTTWLPRRTREGLRRQHRASLRTIPRGARRSQYLTLDLTLPPGLGLGNHRQQQVRWILPRVINHLLRLLERGLVGEGASGVRIAIEA